MRKNHNPFHKTIFRAKLKGSNLLINVIKETLVIPYSKRKDRYNKMYIVFIVENTNVGGMKMTPYGWAGTIKANNKRYFISGKTDTLSLRL